MRIIVTHPRVYRAESHLSDILDINLTIGQEQLAARRHLEVPTYGPRYGRMSRNVRKMRNMRKRSLYTFRHS